MRRRLFRLAVLALLAAAVVAAGCRHHCCSPAPPPRPSGYPPCDCPVGTALPAQRPACSLAAPSGVVSSDYRPPSAAGDPGVRLSYPEPTSSDPPRPLARDEPPKKAENWSGETNKSGGADERPAVPSFPVGISQFAVVKPERVATGLRPHPTDGLAWLQAKGYRAVLHLRRPGEDGAADRRLVERTGLKYVGLELSADTLTRDLAEQFNQLVADPLNQPLFVYDKDGTLTGPLWYLYLRLEEKLPDDKARAQARALGLKENADEQRPMWAAAQKLVPASDP